MEEKRPDGTPLQDIDDRLRKFEEKFNGIIEKSKENEAKRQAEFPGRTGRAPQRDEGAA